MKYPFRLVLTLSMILLIQACQSLKSGTNTTKKYFSLERVDTDELFKSQQSIRIIRIPHQQNKKLNWDLLYQDTLLLKTSAFAQKQEALVAINGGFFDTKRGGSVTYLEDKQQARSRQVLAEPDSVAINPLFNGAIVITLDGQLRIERARSGQAYAASTAEESVLVSGPLLLLDGGPVALLDKVFVTARHPRSCLCITTTATLLVTVDGRQDGANGMNLHELQVFLQSQGCQAAINLDGGGSTTLWTREEGIVNQPSDKSGERAVANVLVLGRKN